MPWNAAEVPVLRMQFIDLVLQEGVGVSAACRRFGISRDTGHRLLRRHAADPLDPLVDRSRRPHQVPLRTGGDIEDLVCAARLEHRWGARKVHALLRRQGHQVPSVRTVHEILRRRGLLEKPQPPKAPPVRFERSGPNELWQMDHKCGLEIGRVRRDQLTILDDHSRYLLALRPVPDRAITTAFGVLWELMARVGMPEAILSDNAFSTTFSAPSTLSWFDANLVCLGIRPIHGRPYHPQTQGKVERLHGTLERELIPFADRSSLEGYLRDADLWRSRYNTLRPHEALGDLPPCERWRASPRPRPGSVPEPAYPAGSTLRRVSTVGDVRWKRRRIMAGRGLVVRAVRAVRVEETDAAVEVYFAHVKIRSVRFEDFTAGAML